jgi:hypothetical protein
MSDSLQLFMFRWNILLLYKNSDVGLIYILRHDNLFSSRTEQSIMLFNPETSRTTQNPNIS